MSDAARNPDFALDPQLLEEAVSLDIDLSRAASEGIRRAIDREHARRWFAENPDYFKSWNEWIEKNGLPLAEYRRY